VVGLNGIRPEVDRELRLHPQQVAPLHRPVVRELAACEEAIDERAALRRVSIVDERPCLVGGRQRPDDVQVGPPDEHGVGTQASRPDVQALQAGKDHLVDRVTRQDRSGALEGIVPRRLRGGAGRGQKRDDRRNEAGVH